jgi:hypothetical protein
MFTLLLCSGPLRLCKEAQLTGFIVVAVSMHRESHSLMELVEILSERLLVAAITHSANNQTHNSILCHI